MKYLKPHWKFRSAIILLIGVLLSASLVGLELTSWADQINQQGYTHGEGGDGEKPNIPRVLMYILPFVKELILIGVPMLLALGYIAIFGRIKRFIKR